VGWNPSYNWIRIGVDNTDPEPHITFELWHRQWRPDWNEFGAGSRDGAVETWRSRIRDHAVLPGIPALTDKPDPAVRHLVDSAEVVAIGDGSVDTHTNSSTTGAEGAGQDSDVRTPLQTADGQVPDARRIRRDLFDLRPPVLYSVLTSCGLLDDEDWKKDYVTVIADAVEAAAARGDLGHLDSAVQAAAGI
jgi:hypothetical protein